MAYLGYPTIVDLGNPQRRHYLDAFDYRLDWTTHPEQPEERGQDEMEEVQLLLEEHARRNAEARVRLAEHGRSACHRSVEINFPLSSGDLPRFTNAMAR